MLKHKTLSDTLNAQTSKGAEPNACWIWGGATARFGHGALSFRGVLWPAHRAAWVTANGSIPDGMCVCHRCDNPPCVNPAHLFLGTRAENNADMARKGRAARGEAHHNAKLDAKSVASIVADSRPHRAIAKAFGIGKTQVGRIKKRQRWAHLNHN